MFEAAGFSWKKIYGDRVDNTIRYGGMVLPAVAVMWWLLERPQRGWNYLFASAGALVAWYLNRRYPKSKIGAVCFLLSLLVTILGEIIIAGMGHSCSLWVLPMFPMLAGYLLGLRFVLPFCGTICVAIIGVHAADWFEVPVPSSQALPDEEFLALFGLTVGYSKIAFFSRKTLEGCSRTLKEQAIGLIKSRFGADRASVAKSAFLANMSQQVKIPLEGASRDARGLVETVPKQELEHALALRECTDRIEWIVNDIVDISRMESGALLVKLELLDFDMIRDSIILECAEVAHRAKIRIDFRQQGQVPQALGDPRLLSRLVIILVFDAIFRARTSVSIEFRFSSASVNSMTLQLYIRHDGLTEDVESSEVVFGMRVQDDEAGVPAKIGLGLSMAESLVEYLGGSLSVAHDESQRDYQRIAQVTLSTARSMTRAA